MDNDNIEDKKQDQNLDNNNDKVEDKKQEDKVEDLFDPFATKKVEDKQEDKKEDKVEDKQEDKKGDTITEDKKVLNTKSSDIPFEVQYSADKQAKTDVRTFLNDHPEFEEIKDDLEDLTSKAIARGHSNPIEFAKRNAKPVEYWMEKARKQAQVDIGNAQQTRIGAGGNSNQRNGGALPDFANMSNEEFNNYYAEFNKR